MPEENSTPQDQQSINWRDTFAKHWMQLRMASEAFMLDKIARGQRARERTERFAATGKIEDMVGNPEDEMGFKIGDTHIYQQPPRGMSTTAKLALAAVLGAAAASMPIWGPIALGLLRGSEAPAVVQPDRTPEGTPPSLRGGGLDIEIVRPNE